MPDDQPGPSSASKKRRRDRGDDGIWRDKSNRCYFGAISLGAKSGGKRNRPSIRGRTKAESRARIEQSFRKPVGGLRGSEPLTFCMPSTGLFELVNEKALRSRVYRLLKLEKYAPVRCRCCTRLLHPRLTPGAPSALRWLASPSFAL